MGKGVGEEFVRLVQKISLGTVFLNINFCLEDNVKIKTQRRFACLPDCNQILTVAR